MALSGNNKRTISIKPCTVRLLRLPHHRFTSGEEVSLTAQKKEPPLSLKCQKIHAFNIRGSQDSIFTGYIDPALIENIKREIQEIGLPDLTKPSRRPVGKDILEPAWEAYPPKKQSSQGMHVCYGDAELIYSLTIPMPGEQKDRPILPAAQESITQLVNTIHTLNPDIKNYFGHNALRLTALN